MACFFVISHRSALWHRHLATPFLFDMLCVGHRVVKRHGGCMVDAEASKGFRVSTFILVLCHPSTLTEQSPWNLRNVPTGLGSPSISNRDLTFGHVCSDDLSLSWCMDKPRVHLKYLHQSHQRDPDARTDSLRTLTGHGGSGEHSVTTGA